MQLFALKTIFGPW